MAKQPHLICLPPAGAGPSLYRDWRAADPSRVRTPSLPGREARLGERVPGSLAALGKQLAEEIAPTLPARYAFFGYSMGAALAYEVCRHLHTQSIARPQALFLLGSNPPDKLLDDPIRLHELDGPAFWAELARIGGTPTEVLEHEEFRDLLEPILRTDLRNCEHYAPTESFRLSCPLHIFVADHDHMVTADRARGWATFTTGPTYLHPIRGKHMLDAPAFARLRDQIFGLLETETSMPVTTVGA